MSRANVLFLNANEYCGCIVLMPILNNIELIITIITRTFEQIESLSKSYCLYTISVP